MNQIASALSNEYVSSTDEDVVPVPFSEAVTHTAAAPVVWTLWNRLLFRVAFLYFLIFIFCYGNGSVFEIFPVVGGYFDTAMTWPWQQAALWVGHHVFHLTGWIGTFHRTGSGDTALDWVLQLLYVTAAVAGGLVWTAIAAARGNRRAEYQVAYAWLRFGVRLTCGFFMMNYGIAKLFPFQMAPISGGILNEPVGQMSPMTLLWALIGLNPGYEMVCGAAEIVGGLLLLYRRTALAGALVSAFVMTNVLLYNMFFDVPVKLFAANLLLALVFLTVPDLPALFGFFWSHTPSAPRGVWLPPIERRAFRRTTKVVEWVFVLAFIVAMPALTGFGWYQTVKLRKVTSPLLGAWHVDAAHAATGPFVTGEGLPATDLYVDAPNRGFTRASDLALWRTRFDISAQAKTVEIIPEIGDPVTYGVAMPDADHVVLTPLPPKADPKAKKTEPAKPLTAGRMSLTRTPLPSHYPLLDRGFHWVNEWGLER